MSSTSTGEQALPDEAFGPPPADPPAYWQESCYFVAHRPDHPGDVLILNLTSQPTRDGFDCLQLSRIDGRLRFARFTRRYGDDPRTTAVGPARVDVLAPYRRIRLAVAEGEAPVGFDLTWTARTRPYLLPRGSMSVGDRLVWDQRHLFQSGWFDGWYSVDGEHRPVRRWWGQRDHSWGVRDHARVPLWMWLAVQLGDGMLGVWCWERPDGDRAYCAGCWAPAGDREPVPVTGFRHRLHWTGADGRPVGYGRAGAPVHGLAGRVEFDLADGRRIGVTGSGEWNARYGRRGGGQHHLAVVTDDGHRGTAIYEITGSDHHHFFPGGQR
ncbi:hypothetical protein [Micromonospora sp. S4605]|uniref:hypothetical protein n=1 Tax=Micromonospora sp. S4605 TaxID=1420897 RepID=UPI001305179E|nr:hypothetical protein [Micromonospora sp. S4605]